MPEKEEENLEDVIKQMLRPLKAIPFDLVIQKLSGCKIIPINNADPDDAELLQDLEQVANYVGNEINRVGIWRREINWAG